MVPVSRFVFHGLLLVVLCLFFWFLVIAPWAMAQGIGEAAPVAAPASMTWTVIFAPAVAGLVTAAGLVVGAIVTGLNQKLQAWLIAHGQSQAAQAVAAANAVIQPALQTSAATMAAKVQSGELDYTDKAAITAEAGREVGIVKDRVKGMVAIASPVEGALVASLVAKLDALMLTAPAAPKAPAAPLSAPAVSELEDAVTKVQRGRNALAALDAPGSRPGLKVADPIMDPLPVRRSPPLLIDPGAPPSAAPPAPAAQPAASAAQPSASLIIAPGAPQ